MAEPNPPDLLAPVTLLQNAPISSKEVKQEHDETFLNDFEDAWRIFATSHDFLSGTATANRLEDLQEEAKLLKHQTQIVEEELKAHGDTLRSKRSLLEQKAQAQHEEGKLALSEIQRDEGVHTEQIIFSMKTHQKTAAWFHFIRHLDDLLDETICSNTAAQPSPRANFIAGPRAYKFDQELSKTHNYMLRTEIERYEKILPIQKELGELFTKLNVWDILRPPSGTEGQVIV